MILVDNEKGMLIAQNLTHDWLLDIVDQLRMLPIGRHFNRQGDRVTPPRPRFTDKHWVMSPGDWYREHAYEPSLDGFNRVDIAWIPDS